jgi:hypothetical protein
MTPNFATFEQLPRPRAEGFVESPSIPIRNIPANELSEMCDAWRAELFAKADKKDPRKAT